MERYVWRSSLLFLVWYILGLIVSRRFLSGTGHSPVLATVRGTFLAHFRRCKFTIGQFCSALFCV